MTTRIRAMAAAAVGALALHTGSAQAHHSFAMYDLQTLRVLTGKLSRFVPGPNHAQLYFELLDADGSVVMDDSGKPVVWGVETGPAATLARQGITRESFPLGTIITVTLSPLRDGRTFGVLNRADERLVRCGMTLPEGGCTEETGELFLDLGN